MNHAFLSLLLAILCLPLPDAMSQTTTTPPQVDADAAPVEPQRIVLQPASAPDPLLRYRLWPAPEKRTGKNASPLVTRAVILALKVPQQTKIDFAESYSKWVDLSVDELPIDEVRKTLAGYSGALGELQRIENVMGIDYDLQFDQLSAREMMQTLLPEFQEMRHLARLLSLRARLAMAEERWDDMVRDCRLGFRLAEVCGHSTDFLIGRLVGFAISGTMISVLKEAIQRPECPNLYWALASLPEQRLFETRDSIEFESVLMARVFQSIEDLPEGPIGASAARERIRVLVREATQIMFGSRDELGSPESVQLLTGIYVVMLADPSRELLADTNEWGPRAEELSASEAVLRAAQLKFSRVRDRWVAWSMLPPETWDEYLPERQQSFGRDANQSDVLISLVSTLAPAVDAGRIAGRRTEQQRNWLSTVEALRMHAAVTGELPVSIENLRPVPAWKDAISNSPFGYHRSSPHSATLTRSPSRANDTETTFLIELKGKP